MTDDAHVSATRPMPKAQKHVTTPDQTLSPEREDTAGAQNASSSQEPEALPPPLHAALRESDFDFAACRYALFRLGVTYTEMPPITDPENRDCGIDRPLKISAIQPGIALEGQPVMRCETARHFALWMRDSVRPAASMLEGAPRVTAISLGSAYACRGVVGGQEPAHMSEHALGNAIDIMSFTFDDGRTYPIQPRKDSGGMDEAFQIAIRGAACLQFTTVIGPGTNKAHDDHFHLDIKARKNGYRLCQ